MQIEKNERESRYKEKVPCITSDYENGENGKPYIRAISFEGKESEKYYPEVSNNKKSEVSSLELINGTIDSIKVISSGEKAKKEKAVGKD